MEGKPPYYFTLSSLLEEHPGSFDGMLKSIFTNEYAEESKQRWIEYSKVSEESVTKFVMEYLNG